MKIIKKAIEIYLMIYLVFVTGTFSQLSNLDIWNTAYITLAILAAIWTIYILANKEKIYLPDDGSFYIIFFLAIITAAVHSINISISLRALFILFTAAFMFVGIISLVNYGWDPESLLNSALIVGALFNIYKIYEIISGLDLTFCSSPIDIPNKTAVFVNIIIMVSISQVLVKKGRSRIFPVLLLASGIFILLFTRSRGGIAAGTIGGLLVVLVSRYQRGLKFSRVRTITAALAVIPVNIYLMTLVKPVTKCSPAGIISKSWTNSIESRFNINQLAVDIFKKYPVVGSGLNTFHLFALPVFGGNIAAAHPHNLYLMILAERGAIGFITAALLVLIMLKRFLFDRGNTVLNAAGIGIIAAILIHGMVDFPFSEPFILRYAAVIMALALATPGKYLLDPESGKDE